MTGTERVRAVTAWRDAGETDYRSAQTLYASGDFRGTVNRAYYCAYRMCASVAVAHRDETQFPSSWNNPSHDQLPELIRNNGDLSVAVREQVIRGLRILRKEREVADYKPWRSVEKNTALIALSLASGVATLLKE